MNNKGFTLFEILIYVAISTVVAGLAVGSLLTFTKIGQRESSSASVTGEMNFVLQRIQQLVSESSNIDIDAGVSVSTVKLRMQDSAKDPTCISLVDGAIKLAEGPDSPDVGGCNTTTSDLTSSKVVVNSLNFKKFTQYPGHDTLSVDMTLSYGTSTASQSYVQKTLSTAIARVSAATFDANVLPGSATYTLGQSTSPWQNIFVGDGSAASPAYSFGNNTNTGLFKVSGTSTIGFATNGTERMRISANGYIAIGTTTAYTPLYINSSVATNIIGVLNLNANGYGPLFQAGGATANNYLFYIRDKDGNKPFYMNGDGNVGIGTISPQGPLQVAGTDGKHILLSEGGVTDYGEIGYGYNVGNKASVWLGVNLNSTTLTPAQSDTANASWYLKMNANADTFLINHIPAGGADTNFFAIGSTGNVGINTAASVNYKLYSNGDTISGILGASNTAGYVGVYGVGYSTAIGVRGYSASGWSGYFDSTGYLGAAAWTYGSDRRMKKNISYLDGVSGLEKVLQLRPAKFDYIGREKEKNQIGFIAQDVQQVIPEAVTMNETNNMLGLKTDFIIPYLVNSTKELNAKIENLQTENADLKSRIDALEAK